MGNTDIGEYLVGAYLNVVEECDFVDYNVHPWGGKMKGLGEFDVIGLSFQENTIFICEVTTHIRGLNYGDYDKTVKRISEKFDRQKEYAKYWKKEFPNNRIMFWSPRVSSGLVDLLRKIKGLELIMNKDYTEKIVKLQKKAREWSHDMNNPAFRLLQIMEHTKKVI